MDMSFFSMVTIAGKYWNCYLQNICIKEMNYGTGNRQKKSEGVNVQCNFYSAVGVYLSMTISTTFFAPELHIPNGTTDISFYSRFGATEHFCFRNDDQSIHVAELAIHGAIFHLHETMRWFDALEPVQAKGVTTVIGLFVDDVQAVFDKGIAAGATLVSPVTDHEYGYRQGMFKDPFGHYWQIQKKISQ
jgi:PhnB protein